MERGAWRTTVCGVTKSQTRLSDSAAAAAAEPTVFPLYHKYKKKKNFLYIKASQISACKTLLMFIISVDPQNKPANENSGVVPFFFFIDWRSTNF